MTQNDTIWAFGSHNGLAATAYFNGKKWQREQYPKFSGSIEPRTALEAKDGAIWFGATGNDVDTKTGQIGGVIRHHGGIPKHIRLDPENSAYGIGQTADGVIWVGGYYGLKRFDGKTWSAADPTIWKGKQCDALYTDSYNSIDNIYETNDNTIWIGTKNGISRFDKQKSVWMTQGLFFDLNRDRPSIDSQNGFGKTQNGAIWLNIGREKKGIPFKTISYLPDRIAPEPKIANLPSVKFPYGSIVAFEWAGTDAWHETLEDFILYAYRLDGGSWSLFSQQKSYMALSLNSGSHVLEVKAIDTDCNESLRSAITQFTILPPIWKQPWFIGLIVIFSFTTVFLISRVVIRTRDRDRAQKELIQTQALLVEEAEEELQTAHDMQMGLMPKTNPEIPNIDIAGRCIPANHVSGDFFQYFKHDKHLTIALADVTGHAMEAAIPAGMFSGILENQMEIDQDLEVLFERMNRSLCRILDSRTFVCLTMGQINLSTHTVRFSNAGGLCPYLYSNKMDETHEQEIHTYPLGISLNTQYESTETQMHSGDYIVFCSDGLAEAQDSQGNQMGFDRLAEHIQASCKTHSSAQNVLNNILDVTKNFIGNTEQKDDITCIVLKVTDI